MSHTTTNEIVFKSDMLKNLADSLKAEGLRVFVSSYSSIKESKSSYFHFTDGINIGYAESPYFGGIKFSTVHKPCRQCGTGFAMNDYMESIDSPTTKDAKACFITAPNWASPSDRAAVIKYKNWDEYAAKNNTCTYIEY